jgi:hypothetical protein
VCYVGEPQKKSDECGSMEQRRASLELSLELASMLSRQFFCKLPFPDSTHFKLKVFIAECAMLESKKKNLLNIAARNRDKYFHIYISN